MNITPDGEDDRSAAAKINKHGQDWHAGRFYLSDLVRAAPSEASADGSRQKNVNRRHLDPSGFVNPTPLSD